MERSLRASGPSRKGRFDSDSDSEGPEAQAAAPAQEQDAEQQRPAAEQEREHAIGVVTFDEGEGGKGRSAYRGRKATEEELAKFEAEEEELVDQGRQTKRR